jgi:hypothetical protein
MGNGFLARSVEPSVHVAEPELAADEQHAVGGPPGEVGEWFGDRFPLQDGECLKDRLEGGHAVSRGLRRMADPA